MSGIARIVDAIELLRSHQERVVVVVGGRAGSGKSTLARSLLRRVPDSVRLRGDDFLDPDRVHRRSPDWDGVQRARMRREAIDPFRRGEPVRHRRLDWSTGRLAPPVTLPAGRVLIVDSIGLPHPDLDDVDLVVWVDTPPEVAVAQGKARDRAQGLQHDALWDEVWAPNDRDFERLFAPGEVADVRYDPVADSVDP